MLPASDDEQFSKISVENQFWRIAIDGLSPPSIAATISRTSGHVIDADQFRPLGARPWLISLRTVRQWRKCPSGWITGGFAAFISSQEPLPSARKPTPGHGNAATIYVVSSSPDLPDGQITSCYPKLCQAPAQKKIPLPFFRNMWFCARVPPRSEGRTRRHER